MSAIEKRYDFALLFDVKDGNPNGDPDAGNLPRVDAETGNGIVTDVCVKRKIRNYVQLLKECSEGFDIYVKEKAVLGRSHVAAFKDLNIQLGEELNVAIHEDVYRWFDENGLPTGLSINDEDNEKFTLSVASDTDKKEVKEWFKEAKPIKAVKDIINSVLKDAKTRKPNSDEVSKGREWMCQKFYDIRTFGAVLSLKSAPNCGQVRGPVQLTFARSVDPVVALEHSITRMAVATEAEAEKQGGDNRTMGRKFTIPYGLYLAHGFISAPLAAQTGFSGEDLELFWEALTNMFEHDHSAARGMMCTRKLIIFEHDSKMGNAPAHKLFEKIQIQRKDTNKPARDYSDYVVTIDSSEIPGVKIVEKV